MPTTILDKLKRTILGQPVADAADLDGEIVFSVTKTTDDKLKIRRQNTAGETVEEQVGLGPGYVRDELYSGDINISDATPTVDIAVNTWTGYNELEIVIDIGTVCSAQAIYGSLNVFRVSQALLASLQAHTGDVEFLNYARRIGTATQFGINESAPAGLASDGNTLYMVGQTNKKRYTLNATTGVASNPGSLLPGTPTALAWHNSKLYLVLINKLYTLNANGEATLVGTMSRGMQGLASLGGTLYGVSSASGGHTGLYSIDTSNANATRIGSATDFGINDERPNGSRLGRHQSLHGRADEQEALRPQHHHRRCDAPVKRLKLQPWQRCDRLSAAAPPSTTARLTCSTVHRTRSTGRRSPHPPQSFRYRW